MNHHINIHLINVSMCQLTMQWNELNQLYWIMLKYHAVCSVKQLQCACNVKLCGAIANPVQYQRAFGPELGHLATKAKCWDWWWWWRWWRWWWKWTWSLIILQPKLKPQGIFGQNTGNKKGTAHLPIQVSSRLSKKNTQCQNARPMLIKCPPSSWSIIGREINVVVVSTNFIRISVVWLILPELSKMLPRPTTGSSPSACQATWRRPAGGTSDFLDSSSSCPVPRLPPLLLLFSRSTTLSWSFQRFGIYSYRVFFTATPHPKKIKKKKQSGQENHAQILLIYIFCKIWALYTFFFTKFKYE